MAPTDAQKRATAEWQKKNMGTVAVKLKKDEIEAFKKLCAKQNKTPNAVLSEYVRQCIGARLAGEKDK